MVKNLLVEGWCGERHNEVSALVRNPFRTDWMRANYDVAVGCFAQKHKSFFHPNGERCIGNSWATRFWRGFDGIGGNWDAESKRSAAYAMHCAGRDIRVVLEKLRQEKTHDPHRLQ